ncbi:MAG: GGDEF domain-containing protein [Oscillospiraceae bacterium]|nr:GGDEF domain-containing protein [Oscillospiraceae bacterium]
MQRSKPYLAAISLFGIAAALFVALFIHMTWFESSVTERARNVPDCHPVENISLQVTEDESAPAGVRRTYSWIMEDVTSANSTLAFYLVHQYTEVYFGDKLMYSLNRSPDSLIGRGPGSCWVTVPVYPADSGKEVRVVLTPVYEAVRNRPTDFQIGPLHSLFTNLLQDNLFQLTLSSLCIVVGAVIMLMQGWLLISHKTRSREMFYLGSSTLLMGVWQLTDNRFTPFMFPGHIKALSYISLSALFLVSIPFALYLASKFSDMGSLPLILTSMVISLTVIAALTLQLLGISDLRENLILAHLSILLLIIVTLVLALFRTARRKTSYSKQALGFSLLLAAGVGIDLISYYIRGNSAEVGFTLLAVLIYTSLLFALNLRSTNRMAFTDEQTGLFNKSRWNLLMRQEQQDTEPVAVMMLDLNRLKVTNDTLGHEAGDRMILSFVNILRNVISPAHVICRWGGDEFTVLVTPARRETLEGYLQGIRAAVDAYNQSGGTPPIYYAAGYAFSEDYPGLTRRELLRKADEQMYQDKKAWYKEQGESRE